MNMTINARNGGDIVSGKTSTGGGVLGEQIYGPDTEFQLLGTAVVKLASHRMAALNVEATAAPTCAPSDDTAAYNGPIEHMLRTVRFHLALKTP
jgi:hypothetical protein